MPAHHLPSSGAEETYGALWSQTLQTIQELQGELQRQVNDLEGHYATFESRYEELTHIIETMGSLYAGCTALEGREELLKLAAVLQNYRRRYTRSTFDFNLVNRLLNAISDLRDRSVADFPVRDHYVLYRESHPPQPDPLTAAAKLPWRWCTFTRGGSWFIIPFDTVEIVDMAGSVVTGRTRGTVTVEADGAVIRLIEPVPARTDAPTVPLCVTINNHLLYAADAVGRRVYARTDIVTRAIRPFRHARVPGMPGRVRLFGRNYLAIIPPEDAQPLQS